MIFAKDNHTKKNPMLIGWSPPLVLLWVLLSIKVNVDESSIGNPGPAGFGGLLRDSNCTCILGFKHSIGLSQILLAELKAIQQGFKLAWDQGFKKVLCESDIYGSGGIPYLWINHWGY